MVPTNVDGALDVKVVLEKVVEGVVLEVDSALVVVVKVDEEVVKGYVDGALDVDVVLEVDEEFVEEVVLVVAIAIRCQ